MLWSIQEAVLVVILFTRKPQGSQLLSRIHEDDVRIRLAARGGLVGFVGLPCAMHVADVANTMWLEAGSETTSVDITRSILSRPSKMGVCAFLWMLSNATYTVLGWLTGRSGSSS